uniref:Photosystem I reaction center subunit IX n=1 Tax=Bostrychia simpliciuscula TaxID=324754 RepID=A0A1Z1M7N6_9FLOR|nr:photosystem I reaction center subunit IX [Bostrychia simpliciuscula]ARW61989.1 photosystem I reaction center subunit IX [Bostrychia simpliciuscula]
MKNNFMKYLSIVPVVGTLFMIFTAGFIIEINRFFPDILFFSF